MIVPTCVVVLTNHKSAQPNVTQYIMLYFLLRASFQVPFKEPVNPNGKNIENWMVEVRPAVLSCLPWAHL